ncbi:hypothetical protein KIPB_001412 [Kipferlia bialata]|uniref:Uncharacterized protein n=1 Tax=Kipferlia bialata TaxID=797122 RepID=A0A9K3CN72_9EUKA|nr:hypothetical protein KIPB_000190 [Kipferlia bialata]GIQ80587.1 hypothetical protein KIPB_001412 [Kipferlia bialata]|eukprot:g190.t1
MQHLAVQQSRALEDALNRTCFDIDRVLHRKHPLSISRSIVLGIHILCSVVSVGAAIYHLELWNCSLDHRKGFAGGGWNGVFIMIAICVSGVLFWSTKYYARSTNKRKREGKGPILVIKPKDLIWVYRGIHTALTVWCFYMLVENHAVLSKKIF